MILEVFSSRNDSMSLLFDFKILQVFSNLNDSMILWLDLMR